MAEKYLVKTDYGDVLVHINDVASGLDPTLVSCEEPTAKNSAEVSLTVPLRAFGAKMLELVEFKGSGTLEVGERLQRLMIQEKATEDLKRIERWARSRRQAEGDDGS